MYLHEQAKEELAGLLAGVSDKIRENGADGFHPHQHLDGYIARGTIECGTDNFSITINVDTHMSALDANERHQPPPNFRT